MKKILKKFCSFMTYNKKYLVVVGGGTKIYNKDSLIEIMSIKTKNAIYASFLSEEVLLVKATYGCFYFIDIESKTYTQTKSYSILSPHTHPIVEPTEKIIYDISNDNTCSLVTIDFEGGLKKIVDSSMYGLSQLKKIDNNIVFIVTGSCDGEKKGMTETRRYIYDPNQKACVAENIVLYNKRAAYFGDDFILYRDGTLLDYEGKLLDRKFSPKYGGVNCLSYIWIKKISEELASKLYVAGKSYDLTDYHMYFIDLEDESFVKEYPIQEVSHVIRMGDDLLIGTYNGVYRIPYREVYPD